MNDIDKLFGFLKKQPVDARFAEWFARLEFTTPAICATSITITRANFRKAMLQAFKEGARI